ncbi:MAG: helix-turn-helix domain-containing protein, partial [Nanoarchaeota archaeon]
MLSSNRGDYLRALYLLEERGKSLRLVNLSSYLLVSKASVSEMLTQLQTAGYIRQEPYAPIHLTAKGRR